MSLFFFHSFESCYFRRLHFCLCLLSMKGKRVASKKIDNAILCFFVCSAFSSHFMNGKFLIMVLSLLLVRYRFTFLFPKIIQIVWLKWIAEIPFHWVLTFSVDYSARHLFKKMNNRISATSSNTNTKCFCVQNCFLSPLPSLLFNVSASIKEETISLFHFHFIFLPSFLFIARKYFINLFDGKLLANTGCIWLKF